MNQFSKLFNFKKKADFPPRPTWKPNLPIDIELVYEKAKYYTGNKFQFAVFKNGTVAFFQSRVSDIDKSAKESIDKIYNFHPDFNPLAMEDGNYVIQYSNQAFTIVFKDEIENNWNYINENHQAGLCKDEVLLNSKNGANIFDRVGKIGLFGRSKMFMDAQEPLVVRTFDVAP